MKQNERLDYLIRYLLEEDVAYSDVGIPYDIENKKRLFRSLMNIRPPRAISEEFIKLQDEYLSQEVEDKGIVDVEELQVSSFDDRVVLWRGDITTLKVDAIVNAANSALRGCFVPCHSCIDNIIHSVSGVQLRLVCDEIMNEQGFAEPTGKAKITPGFNLPSKYVIHTVGPIVSSGLTKEHCELLKSCYQSCLQIASDNRLKSIALCCISTGEFCFPQQKAAEIAVKTVSEFLNTDTQLDKVVFNVFKEEDYEIYKSILGEK